MKKLFCLVCILGSLLFIGCEKKHTTNLSTTGNVQNDEGMALQGIAVITEVEGFSLVDTVYTNENGDFFSRISKIPYPIPVVTITAIDKQGVYQKQTKTPHYMYECGVGFVPENNCAFPADEMIFVLTK